MAGMCSRQSCSSKQSYDRYEDLNELLEALKSLCADPPDPAVGKKFYCCQWEDGERLADFLRRMSLAWRRLKEVSSEEAEPRRHLLRELMKHPQWPGFNHLFNRGSLTELIKGLMAYIRNTDFISLNVVLNPSVVQAERRVRFESARVCAVRGCSKESNGLDL